MTDHTTRRRAAYAEWEADPSLTWAEIARRAGYAGSSGARAAVIAIASDRGQTVPERPRGRPPDAQARRAVTLPDRLIARLDAMPGSRADALETVLDCWDRHGG